MRKHDVVKVEAVGVGVLDRFTSFSLVNDLMMPSEASFELGDDGTWAEINSFIAPGTQYRVYLNGALRLTGRAEMNDVPMDMDGSVVRFTVRTKLADAFYASADPKVRVTGVTIKQFLVQLFAPLGYTEADFIFDADVSRNLMTGTHRTTGKPAADLEPLKEDQAKVNPPETIQAAADRHLRRHGLMLWDSPDGKLVIGAPNDEQTPTYHFRMMHGPLGRDNNLLRASRIRDWSELATLIAVYGQGGKANFSKASIRSRLEDADMLNAGFYRPVIILNEGLTTQGLADRAAKRELTARSKKKEAWDVEVDGLSYWTGSNQVPFAIDTVAEITTSMAGGPAGPHLVHRIECTRTPNEGDRTRLILLKKGLWSL